MKKKREKERKEESEKEREKGEYWREHGGHVKEQESKHYREHKEIREGGA